MIERGVIEELIHAGVRAPSGDNSQPWSFSIEGDEVTVHWHPEKDHPILNVEDRGTLIAVGALIENIAVTAREQGYFADVSVKPENDEARIRLRASEAKGHHLFDSIFARHTHRGPYSDSSVHDLDEALAVTPEPECRISIVTDRNAISDIALAVATMEETALSVKELHYYFFKSLLWSEKENKDGEPGLYVKTTELPAPVLGLFRLIRHWPVMRIFRALGLPKAAAKSNSDVYKKSGALCAVLIRSQDPAHYIAAGRTMQRLWLTATSEGLAAQPLAGLLYLAQYVSSTPGEEISEAQKKKIIAARDRIHEIVGEKDEHVVMLLRVGEPLQPASARTERKPPLIV